MNPGGTTYLVTSPAPVCPKLHIPLDTAIMQRAQDRRLPNFQQGGFVQAPTSSVASAHLQMAYGELCLNGVRSVGAWLAQDALAGCREQLNMGLPALKAAGWQQGSHRFDLLIDASGAKHPLAVRVTLAAGSNRVTSRVEVPLLSSEDPEVVQATLPEGPQPAHLVRLAGITHLVLTEAPFPGVRAAEARTAELAKQFAFAHQGVFGVMWARRLSEGTLVLDPMVVLEGTPPQFFYEQSCGSGAAALAQVIAKQDDCRGVFDYGVLPPGGVLLRVQGQRNGQEETHEMSVEGEVILLGPCSALD